MSATLTWFNSGLGTKTGTAITNFINDLSTLVVSKAGDANFSWEEAGKNVAGTPYWYLLKRKDASAGRIALINWASAPAGNNVAILEQAPATNIFMCYFPNGNVDTLSNLTASSGTICGNDTNCIKVCPLPTIGSMYGTNYVPFYFDCYDGIFLGVQNPASSSLYGGFAGELAVDLADNAYGIVGVSGSTQSWSAFAATSSQTISWAAGDLPAGEGNTALMRSNYGSADRNYFPAFAPSGSWTQQSIGANDILTNTSLSKAFFCPVMLLANQVKGAGIQIKLRQIAWGPINPGQFGVYSETGPVVMARQFCANTAGGTNGSPWVVNEKI